MCKIYHQEDNCAQVTSLTAERPILTCAGVGTVAVAGAAVLGIAGVEAAEVWGLELGTGCVEGGLPIVLTGVRGVGFWAGGSTRSTLFSWRVTLSGRDVQLTNILSFSQNKIRWIKLKRRISYPGAEGPSGWVTDFTAARAGLMTATASSVTWPELVLTVASLLACSAYKKQKGMNITFIKSWSHWSSLCSIMRNIYKLVFLPCPCTIHVQHLTFGFPTLAPPVYWPRSLEEEGSWWQPGQSWVVKPWPPLRVQASEERI